MLKKPLKSLVSSVPNDLARFLSKPQEAIFPSIDTASLGNSGYLWEGIGINSGIKLSDADLAAILLGNLAGAEGFEPSPSSLTVRCPTDWTTPQQLDATLRDPGQNSPCPHEADRPRREGATKGAPKIARAKCRTNPMKNKMRRQDCEAHPSR